MKRVGTKLRWLQHRVKTRALGWHMQVNAAFGGSRVLPDFLIVGAMKSGTTSLFSYLVQHPGIVPPRVKEVHFFDIPRNFRRGEAWYTAHFPTRTTIEETSRSVGYGALTGEATPAMVIPTYAANAADLVPTAKIIMILRNPVDRAFSHYQHEQRRMFGEPLSFKAALYEEPARIARDKMLIVSDPGRVGKSLWRQSYAERGKYIDQIDHWLRYFSRDQLLVLDFEKLETQPGKLCNLVCDFLGIPSFGFRTDVRSNIGDYRDEMDAESREFLTELFRPYNRRLFDFLGEDWGWPC